MSNCVLSWVNYAALAATTLTASSEASGLGANRLKDPQVRKRWRTAAGVTSATLSIDFTTSHSIGVLAFVQPSDAGYYDADLNPVGIMAPTDTIRHRLDLTTPGTGAVYDSGAVAGGWVDGYGLHVHVLSEAKTARYWYTDIDAASLTGSPNYVDIGLAWAGAAWSPVRNMQFGFNWSWQDTSTLTNVPTSGLDFVKGGPTRRAAVFSFDTLSGTEADVITQLSRLVGTSKQVLFIPDPDDLATEKNQPIIGRLIETSPITAASYGVFTKTFTLLQSL